MATKNLNLGIVPVSRGEFNSTTIYYKDNIVQYKRGSYQVISESPITGISPTNDNNVVNPGWKLFAGIQGVDDVPIPGSDNLVKSGGVAEKLYELEEVVDKFGEAIIISNIAIVDKKTPMFEGYLDSNGQFVEDPNSNSYFKTTDYIAIDNTKTYRIDFEGHTGDVIKTSPRVVCIYDASKNHIGNVSDISNISFASNAAYVRINTNVEVTDDLAMYVKDEGRNHYKLLDSIEYDRIEKLEKEVGGVIEHYSNLLVDNNTPMLEGYLDSNGQFIEDPNSNSYFKTTDYIPVQGGQTYVLEFTGHRGSSIIESPRTVCFYASDESYISRASLPYDMTNMLIPNNACYLRIDTNVEITDNIALYLKSEGKDIGTRIKDKARYNRLSELELKVDKIKTAGTCVSSYKGHRKPTICFVLDGVFDKDLDMEAIFSKHEIKIGFAPDFVYLRSDKPQETKDKYISLQEKGHEILVHLYYKMGEDKTISDEQCVNYIIESKRVMDACGLKVTGAVGSSGDIQEKFIPTLAKVYEYAFSKNNHAGSSLSYLTFNDSDPYKLWRYSLQGSTLDEMKRAVDDVITNTGLLVFYGHADSQNLRNFTEENLEALLSYIDIKLANFDCVVKTPIESIQDYYSIRLWDIVA